MKTIKYSLSADNWGDGKSVCLWRTDGVTHTKVARFQNDAVAKMFAEEFDFPLSESLHNRLYVDKCEETQNGEG